jgi:hypothetical protein
MPTLGGAIKFKIGKMINKPGAELLLAFVRQWRSPLFSYATERLTSEANLQLKGYILQKVLKHNYM